MICGIYSKSARFRLKKENNFVTLNLYLENDFCPNIIMRIFKIISRQSRSRENHEGVEQI